ncbi:hypothetical protein K493DRAFT_312742 [Basidiobolus meristosporus CBS 931.73]|uniref:EamA domain-containing protein n=1 Tax=Basidiobolus meristosporus CBS 931.73 TaxID=1314790 RepID=A0A1Y1YT04_9FUNG|nr:hypothetical protein K493DRAFT_312742 [Basidiobolus meristosporus CBS 931.73]|eukprot:ORY00705.1 hypothetical protein K493DRAFT_312742 [Basidiobolus meristosporus CBS 931.73]
MAVSSNLLAVAAGSFAALASLFAKLTVDARTIVLAESLYRLGCQTFGLEVSEYLGQEDNLVYLIIRGLCLGGIFLCNALMWTMFTKALNSSKSSVQVTVLNSVTNFCTTAFCGHVVFGEPLSLKWWCGASLIAVGSILMGQQETAQPKKKEE